MPRPGPRRPQVAFRLAEDEISKVDVRAAAECGADDRARSEMIRRLVAYALDRMPTGWRPEDK